MFVPVIKRRMMPSKLFFIIPLLLLIGGTVLINTVGVNLMKSAVPSSPIVVASMQPSPSGTATLQPANDNTALWTALISSLALNFFNLVSGMFNTWMQFKVKLATHNMQTSLDENTTMTKQTKEAVKENVVKLEESLADKSNHPK